MTGITRMCGWLLGAAVAAVVGCGTPAPKSRPDPLVEVADRSADLKSRVAAVDAARERAGDDAAAIDATQRVFRDVAWNAQEHVALRLAVITSMINDPDPAVAQKARETARLLLPREPDRDVMAYLSKTAADRGWKDYIPPLIRSYSRPLPGVPDEKRPEHLALAALSDGVPVSTLVFNAFLKPPELEPTYGLDWAQRFRADAWDLLARLDADGSLRIGFLSRQPAGEQADPVVVEIRRCVQDLRALPLTGDELKWLLAIRQSGSVGEAWWREATAAVASVSGRGPFSLRHAEIIRWSASNRARWMNASREELISEVETRLADRRHFVRSVESQEYRPRESVDHWRTSLRWADVLTVLVLDDAIRQPGLAQALIAQSLMDRKDETTEYGGLLLYKNDPPQGRWVGVLFPPRPGQRQGDDRFIASEDMMAAGNFSAAHYHFHAQRVRNIDYAGPSGGDLAYAARLGRSCLVFTSVDADTMAVDYYQPDGVVIDLGEISSDPG